MRVLALDSTTRAGSLAIVDDERVVVERSGDASRTHAERLPADILNLGVPLSSIDLFAVASGPGSFTGLRVGIATIQGLAFARRKRVVAISALDALAHIGSRDLSPGSTVGVLIDANRHQVFSALYRVTDAAAYSDARAVEVDPPAVGDPLDTLSRWRAAGCAPELLIGDGAMAYATVVGDHARIVSPPALAGTIGAIAILRARDGRTVDPAGVQPLYIRRPDAEVARDHAATTPYGFTTNGTEDTEGKTGKI